MKKNALLLALLMTIPTQPCKANIKIVITAVASLSTSAYYFGTKLYDSTDFEKFHRLVRKDRDSLCNYTAQYLKKHCKLETCKKFITALEQAQSTPTQKNRDALQESFDAIKKNMTYQNVEQTISDAYQNTEQAIFGIYRSLTSPNKPKEDQ